MGVPEERIKRMDEADNYWAAGPGAVRPAPQLYWDFHPRARHGSTCSGLDDDSRFIEFYNLVFMVRVPARPSPTIAAGAQEHRHRHGPVSGRRFCRK